MAKRRAPSEKRKLRMAASYQRSQDRKANNNLINMMRESRNKQLTEGLRFATKTERRKFLEAAKKSHGTSNV